MGNAKITVVDYKGLPKKAEDIRQLGIGLNKFMIDTYTNMKEMHEEWYGIRYDALLTEMNSMVTNINSMLDLVVDQLPIALETVAKNYARADQGSENSIGSNQAKHVVAISPFKDEEMRFLRQEVETRHSVISKLFKDSISQMNIIDSKYKEITWQSEAATAFRTKFLKLKANIETSFTNIDTLFGKLMTAAEQDMQSAEDSNTVEADG